MNTKSILLAVLWLGSLAGAWWFGKSQSGPASADSANATVNANSPASSNTLLGGGKASGPATGAAAKPALTYRQIINQAKLLGRAGGLSNPSSGFKLMGLLAQIRDEDLQAALAEAEAVTDQQSKGVIMMSLLSRWAEKDGPAALAYAETNLKDQGPTMGMAKMGVISAWAQSEPEAVWKWYEDNKDKDSGGGLFGGNRMSLVGIFSSLAAKDPDKAFQRLATLESGDKQMAMAGMFQSSLFDDATRQKMVSAVDAIADKEERAMMRQTMASQWLMFDQDKATKWIEGLPEDERSKLVSTAGSAMLMNNPKQGAEFILKNTSEADKADAYRNVASMWASQNANAAGEWLGQQPQGPELDKAREAFARTVVGKDAESAMEWAKTITDGDRRARSVRDVFQQWRGKDAAAAEAALQNSGLTPEKIAEIQSKADKP